jgi:hypothetical protein
MANMYEPVRMGLKPSSGNPASAGPAPVTVLMIDDEPMMTDVTQTYLEDAGYRQFVAVNDPVRLCARPGRVGRA